MTIRKGTEVGNILSPNYSQKFRDGIGIKTAGVVPTSDLPATLLDQFARDWRNYLYKGLGLKLAGNPWTDLVVITTDSSGIERFMRRESSQRVIQAFIERYSVRAVEVKFGKDLDYHSCSLSLRVIPVSDYYYMYPDASIEGVLIWPYGTPLWSRYVDRYRALSFRHNPNNLEERRRCLNPNRYLDPRELDLLHEMWLGDKAVWAFRNCCEGLAQDRSPSFLALYRARIPGKRDEYNRELAEEYVEKHGAEAFQEKLDQYEEQWVKDVSKRVEDFKQEQLQQFQRAQAPLERDRGALTDVDRMGLILQWNNLLVKMIHCHDTIKHLQCAEDVLFLREKYEEFEAWKKALLEKRRD